MFRAFNLDHQKATGPFCPVDPCFQLLHLPTLGTLGTWYLFTLAVNTNFHKCGIRPTRPTPSAFDGKTHYMRHATVQVYHTFSGSSIEEFTQKLILDDNVSAARRTIAWLNKYATKHIATQIEIPTNLGVRSSVIQKTSNPRSATSVLARLTPPMRTPDIIRRPFVLGALHP